jgi:vitamin B12 transporter
MKRSIIVLTLQALLWIALFAIAGAAQDSSDAKASSTEQKKEDRQYQIDEMVVTATKVETPAKEVGSSITLITRQDIEAQQKTSVLDILRTVPSLDVIQNGGTGKTAAIFIRGAKSDHTLVLVDGVEMNDPISTGRSFNFANLTVDNIERIEVLRGPQSTLYGSDAMGGVINIITKTGKGKPNGYLSVEGGSFNSFKEAGSVNGGNKFARYSFGFSRQDTDGISSVKDRTGNLEKDGYGSTSFSGKLGITPAQNFDIDVMYSRSQSKTDLDETGDDDPNYTAAATSNLLRTQAKFSLFNNVWDQKIGFSLTDIERNDRNDFDTTHPSDNSLSSFNGRMIKFDWQNIFNIHRTNVLTAGLETEEEEGKSDYSSNSAWGPYTSVFIEKSARTTGYYMQDQIKLWDAWFTTVGFRLDDHDKFGTKATYRVASALVIEKTGTKFKTSFGTGFKSPSLFQLYSPYGDENLEPEESTGWDAGIEQSFAGEKLTADFTYFSNDFENLVDYNSATYKYSNIAKAKTQGIELSASIHATGSLILRGSYTFTKTEDKATGLELLRRAKNKIGFDTNYRFGENGDINFNLTYVGNRADIDYSSYPAAKVRMPGHVVANLAASYNLTKYFQIFGRVDNLFNNDYEEIIGYGTPGASAFGGIKVSF